MTNAAESAIPQMTVYPFNDLEETAEWLKQEANMEETL